MLDELSKYSQLRLFLLSNQTTPRTNHLKNTCDSSLFEQIFFSNEIGMKKPNEDIFQYVLDKISCLPHECIFIDDAQENILTAKKLGIHGIQFIHGEQCHKDIQHLIDKKESIS